MKVSALLPYAVNSRTHGEPHIAQIAASITEFGFTNPILIDGDNVLIAGHGRLLAAKHLGYVIADNKIALNAGWDNDLLAAELARLDAEDFDLALTGFDEKELADLLGLDNQIGLTDPDDIP